MWLLLKVTCVTLRSLDKMSFSAAQLQSDLHKKQVCSLHGPMAERTHLSCHLGANQCFYGLRTLFATLMFQPENLIRKNIIFWGPTWNNWWPMSRPDSQIEKHWSRTKGDMTRYQLPPHTISCRPAPFSPVSYHCLNKLVSMGCWGVFFGPIVT